MTNAHSETGQMAVCCQNLLLGALSSCSVPSMLVGALFKKFGLFLNTGVCEVLVFHRGGQRLADQGSGMKEKGQYVSGV
jgi:hypothetical protein